MTEQENRAEFESWIMKTQFAHADNLNRHPDVWPMQGAYWSKPIQLAWEAWQEATKQATEGKTE